MEFEVKLGNEHLQRVCKTKLSESLNQIIWNAIDADANNIKITYIKDNPIDEMRITSLIVKDDGTGLRYDKISEALQTYGKSEKSFKVKSQSGRNYHGKLGEGRYSYYTLGDYIKWTSTAIVGDVTKKFDIDFGINPGITVKVTEEEITNDKPGMEVEISLINYKVSTYLQNEDKVVEDIVTEFGPYLLAYPEIKIYLNDLEISVDNYIKVSKEYNVKIANEDFKLLFIKWENIQSNELFICGLNDVVYDHQKVNFLSDKTVSIYASSKYFDDLKVKGGIEFWENLDNGEDIVSKIIECTNAFLGLIKVNKEEVLFNSLYDNGVYPYIEEPTTSKDKKTKALFDKVVVKISNISPELTKANKNVQKLTYSLINEALKHNPELLPKILKEVYELDEEQENEFKDIIR